MRVATRWLVVLLLGLPAPALAQAPAREALVGTWLRTLPWKESTGKEMLETDTLVLHPDSTWEMYTINPKGPGSVANIGCSGWFLAGDSFSFGPPVSAHTVHGRTVVAGYMPITVALRDQELTMNVPNPIDTTPKVYKRIGDARPRAKQWRCK